MKKLAAAFAAGATLGAAGTAGAVSQAHRYWMQPGDIAIYKNLGCAATKGRVAFACVGGHDGVTVYYSKSHITVFDSSTDPVWMG